MLEPSVWKWSTQTVREYWRPVALIAVSTALLAVASAAFPIVWQLLIDRAVAGVVDHWLSIVFIGLFVIEVAPIVYVLRARFTNQSGLFSIPASIKL